jgi:hypothetical protein
MGKNFFHKIHMKDNEPVYRKQFEILNPHRLFLEKSLVDWLNWGLYKNPNLFITVQYSAYLKRKNKKLSKMLKYLKQKKK